MRTISNPAESMWPSLIRRPALDTASLDATVTKTLSHVKAFGDAALREFTLQFDQVKTDTLAVPESQIQNAEQQLPKELTHAICLAAENIRTFHAAKLIPGSRIETMPGVSCWTRSVPIQRVGIYIPGGTAPLFSTVLMLGIPAALAKCAEVILCTPPSPDGSIHPAILYAAKVCGIRTVFRIGGAQAIAAMAYGTESVPAVSKIFGPGNQYVTKAKQLVNQEGVAIDFPAGPSEVLIIADGQANPAFLAADLLSQAEHGADSQVVLLTIDERIVPLVQEQIEKQLTALPRKGLAAKALENGYIINFSNPKDAIRFSNAYAPEHLILNTSDCDRLANEVVNAGSVFLGPYSPEAAGDYASGTNHTLPTGGFARVYGGVSCASFMKEITFQQLTHEGLARIGPAVEIMAEAEQLQGHSNAISIRLSQNK